MQTPANLPPNHFVSLNPYMGPFGTIWVCIHDRDNHCKVVENFDGVPDEFGTLLPVDREAHGHSTSWGLTDVDDEAHAAYWPASMRGAEEPKPPKASARTAVEIIPYGASHGLGAEAQIYIRRTTISPAERLFDVHVGGEALYLTSSELLGLVSAAAELLHLRVQPMGALQ